LEFNDFRILRSSAWSDEDNLNIFAIELEQALLPPIKKHLGPPLEKTEECKQFIAKYLNNPLVVCGPYVDEGRWITDIKRRHVNAADLLNAKLEDGGRSAGVADQISHVLKKDFKILVNEEIVEIYRRNHEFAVFLTEFLSGKPKWLEPTKA
jgi:tRNA nucleotidyltransferase (CCA-adding enzyme)